MVDEPGSIWASNGEGVGSYIEIRFKKEYQVTRIQYVNRVNAAERNRLLEINLGLDNVKKVILRNSDKIVNIPLETPAITSAIKFQFEGVYSTLNNGGAFNIFGLDCKPMMPELTAEELSETVAVHLNCAHNLNNNDEISKKNLYAGEKFLAQCNSNCLDSTKAVVFGDLIYAEISSICKAAAHSGVLKGVVKSRPKKFIVMIEKGRSYYEGFKRNGISSSPRETNQIIRSMTFAELSEDLSNPEEKIFEGMQVDLLDDLLKEWVPGIVGKIDRQSKKVVILTVEKNSDVTNSDKNKKNNNNEQKVKWRDPTVVDYCGEQLKDRKCDKNSTKPGEMLPDEIKICFTPDKCPEGYLADNGQPFTNHSNLEYGWSDYASSLTRRRFSKDSALFSSLILFPPDKQSKWCTSDNPVASCEPIDWSIKV